MTPTFTATAGELFVSDGSGWIPLDHVSVTMGYDLVPPDYEFRISRENLVNYSFTSQIIRPARNRVQNILYSIIRRSEGRDKRYARRMRRHQKRAWRAWQEGEE